MEEYGRAAAERAAAGLRERIGVEPRVMLILGSGLGELADAIEGGARIPFGEIPGFPPARVAGHRGQLVGGRLEGVPVVAMQGRFHLYEGHSAAVAAFPVRVMAALGARTLLVTNAAGGLNRTFEAGDLMLIEDHVNLTGRNPLLGPVVEGDLRFPDMSSPYDPALQALAERIALERRLRIRRGVYVALLGPSYETAAEVRMLQRMGGDAVGMSTVPEVIVARASGIRVLGISLVTNPAAGITGEPLSHEDVVEAGSRAAKDFGGLVRALLREPELSGSQGGAGA